MQSQDIRTHLENILKVAKALFDAHSVTPHSEYLGANHVGLEPNIDDDVEVQRYVGDDGSNVQP
jgi:hypothetical protein